MQQAALVRPQPPTDEPGQIGDIAAGAFDLEEAFRPRPPGGAFTNCEEGAPALGRKTCQRPHAVGAGA